MRYMQWIPVSKRLPDEELEEYKRRWSCETSVEVIVLIEGALVPTALYYNGQSFTSDDGDIYEVSHWMSMPPSPEDCVMSLDFNDDFEPEYEKLNVLFFTEV